jgi:hypothetical protein
MCEFVFLNHVNICGSILQLTPKNDTNLANFELTKKVIDLINFPKSLTSILNCGGTGFGPSLARLLHESRQAAWRDSVLSRTKCTKALGTTLV